MPLHVDVAVNADRVGSLHVGRLSRHGMDPDSVNLYAAVVSDRAPLFAHEWDAGALFLHRYGDGAFRCVELALAAVRVRDEQRVCVVCDGALAPDGVHVSPERHAEVLRALHIRV